ncbi:MULTISPECIES: RIP metalloprotease RseP [unclassified Marinovum]
MDISQLIPQFGGTLFTLVAFVVALSIIVAIHEYGHYIVGRWSGIKADVFSLGFGPVLFKRTDKHGTVWQIAALPLGGYVKFRGDADAASAGTDEAAVAALSEEDRRTTMAGAPLWARTATVAAGPIFNFVLAIVLFSALFLTRGVISEPLTVGELRPMPTTQELQEGDVLLSVAGANVPDFSDADGFSAFVEALPSRNDLDYRVIRGGDEITVTGPYPYPPNITRLVPRSAAYDVGLAQGDVIIGVDGQEIATFEEVKTAVEASEGRALLLDVWRDGETLEFALAPRRVDEPGAEGGFVTQWRVGIVGGLFFEPAKTAPGFGKAVQGGVLQTWSIMKGSVSGMWHIVTGQISSCNLSGPVGIAETSGQMAAQGTSNFLWFVAVLSAAVGLLNLFPIPVLDGGHLVFYAYEAVVGRPPHDKVLSVLMTIGIGIVLSVMVFSLSNDLILCP